jgi:hypothetical protein
MFKCKILRNWETLVNLVSKSAPIWMKFSGFIHFEALKTNLLSVLHENSANFDFDLRPIESSMLFAVIRPLRTPVPNG